MTSSTVLLVVCLYFVLLLFIAYYTSRGSDNETFFIGKRKSHWLLVAYGMIGTSLSGVTFMSVPGEVQSQHFIYLQVVLGYFLGYIAVAFILLPLYYRLQVTSIYTYLSGRLGFFSYKTGAAFFLVSRTLGASIRIYLVLIVLQHFLLDGVRIPWVVSVAVILVMILLYTYNGGVKTIVWTDTLQTTGMILALLLTIWLIADGLELSFAGLWQSIRTEGYTQMFQVSDWRPGNYFLKHLIGGAFVTITMTGLDQEMMQKNISVSTLRQSQKNMMLFSVILVAVNLLFLILGGALYLYAAAKDIPLPARTDETFPMIALNYLPGIARLIFIIGLVSALFPSADGALTALTSSFCIDLLGLQRRPDLAERQKARIRKTVHLGMAALFFVLILAYRHLIEASVISTILKVAGYTYGPLLGLFAFGVLTNRNIRDSWWIPVICLLSPAACWLLSEYSQAWFDGYRFGFELLAVNGLLTFAGLLLISVPGKKIGGAPVIAPAAS